MIIVDCVAFVVCGDDGKLLVHLWYVVVVVGLWCVCGMW